MSHGPEEIALAIARLRAGGLVAFPTETVYGLGADAFSVPAVRRVFEIKGRPEHNPLIVHVSGPEMGASVVSSWPREAQRLAEAFWPGPLSLVLPASSRVPREVTAGAGTVAVRAPGHPLTLALIEAFGLPLVGPSANRSGGVSPTRAEHVRAEFNEADVLVLDGGPCRGGIESTVLWLADEPWRVLRPGLVSVSAIEGVLGRPVAGPVAPGEGAPADAMTGALPGPGLMARHYAPRTPASISDRTQIAAAGADTVAIVMSPDATSGGARLIRLPTDAPGYARGLYDALRSADDLGAARLLIEWPPRGRPPAEADLWCAIYDRLGRATR
ncbi:MAG: threonylcarbamoyl-AMP synthase [Phycisphaerales bacterium]|nr:threonylcarbamoyl-AMP synthase [Phycisphaerales bacterium]